MVRLAFLNWLEEYLLEHEMRDVEIWRAVKRELRFLRYPTLYRILGFIEGLVPPVKGAIDGLGRWAFGES